jgi:hypothetical protein
VEAWVGLPYVRVAYRVFNDTGENRRLDLSRLTLVAGEGAPWGDAKPVMATSVDPRVAGPAGVIARPGFGVGLRRFWQQFPKAMLPGERSLEIDLYHPIDPESVHGWFATGEAKRHELLICAGPLQSDNDAALAAFDDPPRLFDKHWHTQSGGWGPAMWRGGSQFAAHQEQMGRASRYSPATTVSGEYGVRNYGDQRYGAAADDTWFDNYYDPLHSLFGEYLMSGQRAWFPRAEAMCQHLMDVDIIHASVTHPERVGGINGYTSSHHNVGSYVHTYCLSPKGYLDYYHLTGDPDAREAALGLGEYVRRAGTGKGARSVREQAWPLTALMSVYRETWDPALLSVARTLFEDCMVPLDPRRGAYAEWHGSWNYVGTIPWMSGQMMEDFALYYWATGDRRAAERLVGLANALYCENMGGPTALPLGQPPTRGQVGVTTYSPNPFLANWSAGYVFLTNTGWAYAADLTGRREFIAAMRNGYDVAAEQRAIGFGTYWQAPVLLYYLHYFSNK